MQKEIIKSNNAPDPIGPYSQAVKSGNLLFLSGQIAIDPKNGQIINENITEETAQVMANLKEVLKAAGAGFENVVKTSIFLSDINLFAEVNKEYGKYFTSNFPSRETVAVKTLPKNVNVEISMIAIL